MITRRHALNVLIAGTNGLIAALLAVPVVGYLLTPLLRKTDAAEWVPLGLAADLQGIEPKRVDFQYKSELGYTSETVSGFAYLVPGEDEGASPVVLSPVCTHMGCNVVWNHDQKRFLCPCHGGQFTADGRNVAGPPPRPLNRIPARVEDGVLKIQAGATA